MNDGQFFGFLFFLTSLLAGLFYGLAIETRNILDKYRIKYGFDKTLEHSKNETPKSMERREENFRKRTFRDVEEKKE